VIGDLASGNGLIPYFNPNSKFNVKMLAMDKNYNYLEVALLSLVLGLGSAFFAIALCLLHHLPFFCNDMV